MKLNLSYADLNPKLLNDSEFIKFPLLSKSKTENFKFSMKIQMINANTAVIFSKMIGTTDLNNVEKLSDLAWNKVEILRKNNIASILYIDNSENNSPTVLNPKSMKKIYDGTNNPMTYAIFVLLSKNIISNKGISFAQAEPDDYKLKKKIIIYGFQEKEKLIKHINTLTRELSNDSKLSSKLKNALNPAYFILSKICKVRLEVI